MRPGNENLEIVLGIMVHFLLALGVEDKGAQKDKAFDGTIH